MLLKITSKEVEEIVLSDNQRAQIEKFAIAQLQEALDKQEVSVEVSHAGGTHYWIKVVAAGSAIAKEEYQK